MNLKKNIVLLFFISCFFIMINNKILAAKIEDDNKILAEDFLETQGTEIVNQKNEEIILRGYNLGLWFSRSFWGLHVDMQQNQNSNERYSPINSIEMDYELFSNPNLTKEQVLELNELFYSNQITEKDLDIIADTGINLVRVPFEWTFFMRPEYDYKKGNIKNADYNQYGALSYIDTTLENASQTDKIFLEKRLSYLEWIVEECSNRGIYVIFDLHVAPGGLNAGGFREKPYFFEKSIDGEARRKCALRIWKKVAERFKNNPAVAGYDIVNEPAIFNETEVWTSVIDFYDEAYKIIRNVEKDCVNKHIIIMEGKVKSYSNDDVKIQKNYNHGALPNPITMGWENIIYSKHDYFFNFRNSSIDEGMDAEWQKDNPDIKVMKARIYNSIQETKETMEEYNVPVWIGEFSCHAYYNDKSGNIVGTFQDATGTRFSINKEYTDEIWKYQIQSYEKNKISYAAWSYKARWEPYFGLVYYSGTINRVNLKTATYAEILKTMKANSENSMKYNKEFHNIFKQQIQLFAGVDISKNGDGSVIAKLSNDKLTLTITGKGEMADFSSDTINACETYNSKNKTVSPWYEYRNNIENVLIEEGIINIGQDAFLNCSNLKNVDIPETLNKIGAYAFHNCNKINSIKIPNSVTNINMSAFYNCAKLKWIELGKSVSYIGENVFSDCTNLENIYVFKSNEKFSAINGVLYNKDKTELIKYPEGKTDSEYVISNSTKIIKKGAFEGCKLKQIIIPKDVIQVEVDAFKNSENLTIICKAETVIENYAKQNGIAYVLDKGFPKITFDKNGAQEVEEIQKIRVTVEDTGIQNITGIDESNLKYCWSQQSEGVKKSEINIEFSRDEEINTPNKNGIYYLWVLARDKVGNEMITRSEAFNLNIGTEDSITNIPEDTNNNNTSNDNTSNDNTSSDNTNNGNTNNDNTSNDNTNNGNTNNDNTSNDNTNNDNTNNADTSNDNTSNGNTNNDNTSNDNTSNNKPSNENVGNNNANSNNTGNAGGASSSGGSNDKEYKLLEEKKGIHTNYIQGYEDKTVRPDNAVSREEIAMIFYRLTTSIDRETFETAEDSYIDVTVDRWSNTAIAYLKEKGIMQGYPDGSFKPQKKVTRAEFAAIIAKYLKKTKSIDVEFSNLSKTHWAQPIIEAVVAEEWMNGYSDKTFKPEKSITRAETMTVINRMLNRKVKKQNEKINPFVDLNETHWAYTNVIEATVAHRYTKDKNGYEIWQEK